MPGIPVRRPSGERVKPGANDPDETDQVYGLVPPTTWRLTLYGDVKYAVGSVVVATERAVVTMMLRVWDAMAGGEPASRTEIVTGVVAAAVAVPTIVPAAESVRPAGSVPDVRDHV